MRVAVLGCGAIGGLFLGYLSERGIDVTGVVKDYQKEPLLREGLVIEGVRGKHNYKVRVENKLNQRTDLAIFASKIGDLESLVEENLEYLKDAVAITVQNGVRADYILNKYFPQEKIITGIVMFGGTFYRPNRIVHNFEGNLILGNIFGKEAVGMDRVVETLRPAFAPVVSDRIKGAKYLKLFINLNNCIPAILGLSMQECFADISLARLAVRLNREAFDLVKAAGIELADLPDYPKTRLEALVGADLEKAAGIFSQVMSSLSKEPLFGSILQSIKSGRPSEIDHINGEIVRLAFENNLKAPLNGKIVELVHKVEGSGKFLNKEELLKEMENCNG